VLNSLLGTCVGLELNTVTPSALVQQSGCGERSGESAEGRCPERGRAGLAAGWELRQRRVMPESQMGEPVRSKAACAEGGRLGRAARRRSFSPCTPSAAEVCGWAQSGAERSRY